MVALGMLLLLLLMVPLDATSRSVLMGYTAAQRVVQRCRVADRARDCLCLWGLDHLPLQNEG